MYATLDEHSNRSLVRKDFFDIFNIKTSPLPYTLKTCAGLLETAGRIISDFIVESIDGNISLPLPSLLECNQIPNNRTEIPTPDAAFHHSHVCRHVSLDKTFISAFYYISTAIVGCLQGFPGTSYVLLCL